MRYIFPILFVVATLLVGCHSPSPVHSRKVAPIVAAPPPFHPMLITTFGTHPSPDGSWRITVSQEAIDFTRPGAGGTAFTPDSQGWRAQAGWFVFIESKSRVWAYDGNRQLYLDAETSGAGTLYCGVFRATNFDSNFPCAVPPEVISSLPEQKQKEIQKGRTHSVPADPKLDFVNIALIPPEALWHVYALFGKAGIDAMIVGSDGFGVIVARSDRDRAIELLKKDSEIHNYKYPIRFN